MLQHETLEGHSNNKHTHNNNNKYVMIGVWELGYLVQAEYPSDSNECMHRYHNLPRDWDRIKQTSCEYSCCYYYDDDDDDENEIETIHTIEINCRSPRKYRA
jgi:hypothetical protein